MKPQQRRLTSLILIALSLITANLRSAFADPLAYSNQQDDPNAPSNNVTSGYSNVAPVTYGTNYEGTYSPYASFMQSPYSQGPMQQRYGGGSPNPQGPPNPAMASQRDPLNASEVSPYSHYSPYIEVVGEGSNYTLGIDDIVTIIVKDQPDFSGRFIVDPEGNVQYNFVGDIKAVGKTKEQLKAEIIKRLTRYVRYPEAAVMISEYRSKAIYVFGFVNRPGKYAMKGDKITVKEAIVAAGLPREDAAIKKVFLVRPSEFTKNGKPITRQVNLKAMIHKGESAEDFLLLPGDTIVVNQKHFEKFVSTYSKIIGPVFQTAAVYELGFGGDSNGFLRKGGRAN